MKKSLILSITLVSLSATRLLYADSTLPTPPPADGFYVSGGLGYGGPFLHKANENLSTQALGLAGQTAMGYLWHHTNIQYGPELEFVAYNNREIHNAVFQASYSGYHGSLLGVLKNNINNHWHVEGKAGIAYVFQQFSSTFIPTNTQKKILPELALGLGYNLTPKVSTNLTASWIFGNKPIALNGAPGQLNNDLNKASPIGTLILNINYSFQ